MTIMDGERAARTADGKVYYVPANMNYTDWKKAFVDGVKDRFDGCHRGRYNEGEKGIGAAEG